MLRGLYTAAAGMISEQRRHDTITNNIANINSPGFKQGSSLSRSFPEMLISRIRGGQDGAANAKIGRLNTGVFAEYIPKATYSKLKILTILPSCPIFKSRMCSSMPPASS
jgi:flagellar basal body rod protein FlgG